VEPLIGVPGFRPGVREDQSEILDVRLHGTTASRNGLGTATVRGARMMKL